MKFQFKDWKATIAGVLMGAGNVVASPDIDVQTGLLSLGIGVLGNILDRQMQNRLPQPSVVPPPMPAPAPRRKRTRK